MDDVISRDARVIGVPNWRTTRLCNGLDMCGPGYGRSGRAIFFINLKTRLVMGGVDMLILNLKEAC
uniref:Uncharacterized protein n=1 Tax=Megaselia scalaris TaxID=36166 RepID=T1GDC6_MEGSC